MDLLPHSKNVHVGQIGGIYERESGLETDWLLLVTLGGIHLFSAVYC